MTGWRCNHIHQTDGVLWEPAVRCLTTDRWKFVHYQGKDFGELYDLRSDPRELRNLWADANYQGAVAEMKERLLAHLLEVEPLPPKTDQF